MQESKGSIVTAILVPVLMLILVLVLWFLIVSRGRTPLPPPPPPPPAHTTPTAQQRQAFFDQTIKPILDASERHNAEAAERAVLRIREAFSRYRSGVKPFTEDITSIKTRFHIMTRMPGDWWNEQDNVQQFIKEKFESHILSEQQFMHDLGTALVALKQDLEANQNNTLVQCRTAVTSSDLPTLMLPSYPQHQAAVAAHLSGHVAQYGRDSVVNGLTTMMAAEAAGILVEQIVVQVLIRAGTSATTAAAATAGGAATATVGGTAAGSAAGSTLGSFGGPAGTAVGVAAGFVVGILIDWWMTERFERQLTGDLHRYLDQMESQLLDDRGDVPGLKNVLHQFCDEVSATQAGVIRVDLVGAQPEAQPAIQPGVQQAVQPAVQPGAQP